MAGRAGPPESAQVVRRCHAFGTSLLFLGLLLSVAPATAGHPPLEDAFQTDPFVLTVAVLDEMKSRNLLRASFYPVDVWTKDVLDPVVARTTLTHPDDGSLLPYAMVGTDANGDGSLDAAEIGGFANVAGQPDAWVAFYDLRGMRFHDGTPVEREDILFSHHVKAFSPIASDARFTKDQGGAAGTNHSSDRWLSIHPEPVADWLGAPPGPGQFALRFVRTAPTAYFARETMQTPIHPAYLWQGTGVRKDNGTIVAWGVHADFGWAVNPDPSAGPFLNGVPSSGLTTTQDVTFEGISIPAGTSLAGFDLAQAAAWEPQDADVIGAGPMRFGTVEWLSHVRIDRNPDFFIPEEVYRRETLLRVPALEAVVFRLYRNGQSGIFALQSGEVDFINSDVTPYFLPNLLEDPTIGVKQAHEDGFAHVGYNMRRLPFGYEDPLAGSDLAGNDVGLAFRRVVDLATDRDTILTSLLQGYGTAGHAVVSPSNTLFHNATAAQYSFDLELAQTILDDVYGPDPYGDCRVDGWGCRVLPGKGSARIDILTPQADYDPIRANSGTLIATNLRLLGLNVVSVPTAFAQISTRVFEQQDFDMYLLDWPIDGFLAPTYIESFFHTRNDRLDGMNAIGYRNATLDGILDAAMGAEDPQEAVRLWKWAQGAIAADGVYDVLYHRTHLSAYRMDRIKPTSWQVHLGGDIWAFWSWIGLDPADPDALVLTMSAPDTVSPGQTVPVVLTVQDAGGQPFQDATLSLTATGPGTLMPTSGTSNADGLFTATFTPPFLGEGDLPVETVVQGRAGHDNVGASRAVEITIRSVPAGYEPPGFVPYSHASGFSVPIPEEWTLIEDQPFENGTIEVTLLGPVVGAVQTNIVIDTDVNATIRETTSYLDSLVGEVVDAAAAESGYSIEVAEGPVHRTISGHAAVTFRMEYRTTSLWQKAAIVVSEEHLRYWILVLTVDRSLYPRMNETFEAMLTGFEVTPSGAGPGFDLSWLLLLAGILGGVGAAVAVAAIVLVRRSRTPHGPPTAASALSPAAAPDAPAAASRVCPQCGTPGSSVENYCVRCGAALPRRSPPG